MTTDAPYAFGQAMRAARLGYHWCARMKAFLRLATLPDGTIEAAIVPPGKLKGTAKANPHTGETFRVWWEGPHVREMLAASPYLSAIVGVKHPFRVVLGDDGMPVGEQR